MGGGVVSVHIHDEGRNELIRHLISNRTKMDELFEDIAGKQECQVGRINNADQINLVEIVTYFKDNENPCFEGFGAHASIAKQALKYTETHSKKKKRYKDQVSRKQFTVFLPTMFLFSHLWRIFESDLDNGIDDKRIFKHEFVAAHPRIKSFSGVDFSDNISEEVWGKEFDVIDVNKNGFISFAEFCNYCTNYIVTPKQFIQEIMDEECLMLDHEGNIETADTEAEKVEESMESVDNIKTEALATSTEETPGNETVTKALHEESMESVDNTKTETLATSTEENSVNETVTKALHEENDIPPAES